MMKIRNSRTINKSLLFQLNNFDLINHFFFPTLHNDLIVVITLMIKT
jgi:hypothetical protein